MEFCKLYIHEKYGQILCIRENDNEGCPSVKFMAWPLFEKLEPTSIVKGFHDSESGEKMRNLYFNAISEESAFEMGEKIFISACEALGE